MANGPFGNPLSTGIALSFEVDMTPYRQMHARKMANIEEKKKERKKQQAELQNILKNITVDTSKVHERYKDDAMNEYAATINDVMSSFKSGNVAGTYQRINKFNNQINSYVNATQNFNNYVKSKGDKTFRNDELIRAMDNVEGVSDDQLLEMFQNDIDYSNGLFNFTVIDRPDLIGHSNKVLQGVDKEYMKDDAGKYIKTGKVGPKGTELFRQSIPNPEQFFQGEANWLKSSAGGNRLLMEYGGITPAQLDERDASGRQLRDVLADKYVRELLSPKVYGEKGIDPYKPSTKEFKGWTFGGGGAKSPNWEVNKVSNIPVSLTDEVGGSLSGWKVDYTKQTGVSEIERNIELGKGAYFAEGGSKIQKVSDAASGLGKIIKGTPAGIYVRDDKEGGQTWVAYETNYIPPTDEFMKNFKFDPNSSLSKEEQKQVYMDLKAEEDKDLVSKTTKRIVYVPITSDSEKIEFRTTMGMSEGEFNQLIDMIGASPTTGSSLNQRQESALDAFEKQYGRQPTASERQKILKKYQ